MCTTKEHSITDEEIIPLLVSNADNGKNGNKFVEGNNASSSRSTIKKLEEATEAVAQTCSVKKVSLKIL